MVQQQPDLRRRWRNQSVPLQFVVPAFSFRALKSRPAPSSPFATPAAPLPVETLASPSPSAPTSPQVTPTLLDPIHLTPSELRLILHRRLQNLSLPDTPHLLLAERLSTTLTTLTSLLCKLHLLQTPQVRALRTNNHRLFSRIRLLSLLNLPAPRLLLYPLFRHLPALQWILAPFRAMAVPFLLDAVLRFAANTVRSWIVPRPRVATDLYADLSSLRDHLADKLRHSRDQVNEMMSKANTDLAHLRQDLELKLPPALALPPSKMPYTPREKAFMLRTPVKGRSFLTSVKGRAFKKESSENRRGLQTLAEDGTLESPSLTLLPQSIARPVDS